ncbi:MAG: mucoidy inhibitor MuiA family protein [Bacteroidia bacterium]|nr:mucoidy inhibitor MuiA family protein [Bacteroidia bacterium]
MIRNVIFLLLLLSLTARGNEKKVIEKSIEVKRVTVYLKGAQITGSGSAFLSPGESTLKFTGLPSDLDSKSIRVTSSQNLSILAVNSGQDFLTSEDKNELILQKDKIIADIRNNRVEMEILNKRLDFLTQNQKIAGSQNGIVLEKLIAANEYFTKEFTGLSEKKKEAELKSERLNEELQNLEKQINESNQKEQKNLGNITVSVDVAAAGNYDFNIEFHTQNAGWFPSYDFRVRSVNEPMEMNYRANVYQNTGIDWKNVQLKLSSANPDHSAQIPEMKTYYLDFGKLPPRYGENTITRVSGRVFSAEDNTPLIGASVMVKNNSIGTITDSNGKYELNIPENAESLLFSFIGMETQERYINQSVINVSLTPSLMALDEVVWLITLLANQSVLVYNLQNPKAKKELLTEESVELLTSPFELATYKNAIMDAMYKGTKREVESEPDAKNSRVG